METNVGRIKKDIEVLAQFNSTPKEGMTRLSFTPEDKKARDYVMGEMQRIGLKISVDAAGNIIGRWQGEDPTAAPVMAGSHLDSVPHGGIFDGTSGVVAALESARVLSGRGQRLKRSFDVVVFTEEEGGGRFRAGLFGSRSLTGQIKRDMLESIKDFQGIPMARAMADFGLSPTGIEIAAMKPSSVHAFVELHIEQGPVLEKNDIPVGIVTAIFGIEEGTVQLKGSSGHAGAIPMVLRHDSMTAAAKIIVEINRTVKEIGSPAAVGTVGLVQAYPGVINIIPDNVLFTYDMRDTDNEKHQAMLDVIKGKIRQIAKEEGLREEITVNLYSPAVILTERVINVMQEIAGSKDIPTQPIVSGAGHDAMVMPRISDNVNMIFVRSKGGHSHRPDEWTDWEDLHKGTELLLETVTRLGSE
jgi:allantoate deiminase